MPWNGRNPYPNGRSAKRTGPGAKRDQCLIWGTAQIWALCAGSPIRQFPICGWTPLCAARRAPCGPKGAEDRGNQPSEGVGREVAQARVPGRNQGLVKLVKGAVGCNHRRDHQNALEKGRGPVGSERFAEEEPQNPEGDPVCHLVLKRKKRRDGEIGFR